MGTTCSVADPKIGLLPPTPESYFDESAAPESAGVADCATPEPVAVSPKPQTRKSSEDAEECDWVAVDTVEHGLTKYIKDGTLSTRASPDHVELRTLLSETLATDFLLKYSASMGLSDSLLCWIDAQKFRQSGYSERITIAKQIYEKYICDGSPNQLDWLEAVYLTQFIQGYRDSMERHERDPMDETIDETLNDIVVCLQRPCFNYFFASVFIRFKKTNDYVTLQNELKRKINFCQPKHFHYIEKLGEGGFGLVMHVIKKSTHEHYAMKIQTKIALLNNCRSAPERVTFERQALELCVHPYIAQLYYAFDTPSLAILCLSMCNGMDMIAVMKSEKEGRLSEERVQFYSAEIVSALTYMHAKGLIYRDLKPSNILLDGEGHIQIIDLGSVGDIENKLLVPSDPHHSSVLLHPSGSRSRVHRAPSAAMDMYSDDEDDETCFTVVEPKRRNSIIGTYGYMAPEVAIMQTQQEHERIGYSQSADFWSLGITMYNMLCGKRPFNPITTADDSNGNKRPGSPLLSGSTKEKFNAFQSLLSTVSYPTNIMSPVTIDFISQLLQVNPQQRLGHGGDGAHKIRSHPYFKSIVWRLLDEKELDPPYVPAARPLQYKPNFENFEQMMKDVDRENWLDCPPPEELDKYFADWHYCSDDVIATEQSHSNRSFASSRSGSKNAKTPPGLLLTRGGSKPKLLGQRSGSFQGSLASNSSDDRQSDPGHAMLTQRSFKRELSKINLPTIQDEGSTKEATRVDGIARGRGSESMDNSGL